MANDKFKFDPNSTENEGRWRLKDPKTLDNYFRRKSSVDGISYVIGKNKKTNKEEIQAIRFNRKIWDEKAAGIWWNKNKDKYDRNWSWSKSLGILEDKLIKMKYPIGTIHDYKGVPHKKVAEGKWIPVKQRKTGLFNEYNSKNRDKDLVVENVSLTEKGYHPDDEITIYRGVPSGVKKINNGDWVTTNKQLARDYAGTGDVISMKVKAKTLFTEDTDDALEELIYNSKKQKINKSEEIKEFGGEKFRKEDGHWLPTRATNEKGKQYKPILTRKQNRDKPITEEEQNDVIQGLKDHDGWKVFHHHFTNIPRYIEMFKNPKSFRKKGIEFKIVNMTPKEYEESIADGFWLQYRDNVEKYRKQGKSDKELRKLGYPVSRDDMDFVLKKRLRGDKIAEYKALLTKKHSKSPLVSIEIGDDGRMLQEGHHRTQSVRELGIEKMPVLIVWHSNHMNELNKYPTIKKKLNMNKAIEILSSQLFKSKIVDDIKYHVTEIEKYVKDKNVDKVKEHHAAIDSILHKLVGESGLTDAEKEHGIGKSIRAYSVDVIINKLGLISDTQRDFASTDDSFIIKDRLSNLVKSAMIEKSKKYPIGTVRSWKGKPHRKVKEGEWMRVKEEESRIKDLLTEIQEGRMGYKEAVDKINELNVPSKKMGKPRNPRKLYDDDRKFLYDTIFKIHKMDKKNVKKIKNGYEINEGDSIKRLIKDGDFAVWQNFDKKTKKWNEDRRNNWRDFKFYVNGIIERNRVLEEFEQKEKS